MINLPDIIELNNCGGNFTTYIALAYDIFEADFITTRPVYRGVRLGLKSLPLVDGKSYTFYHMTHEGNIETDRIPDLRRIERIPWPRPMIDDSTNPDLKVWRNVRKGKGGTKNRILILHERERYLVVLDDRGKYILPWTAYYLRSHYEVQNKLKEYNAYIKAEAAK